LARSAVLRAAGHARIQQSIEDEVRPEVAAAAKYFQDEGRWLRAVVYGAERKAQILVDGLDELELDLPHREDLLEALSRSREILENSTRNFVALHKQVSRNRGEVWRLSFVRSLFCRMVAAHWQGSEIVAGAVSGIHLRRLVQPVAGGCSHRC
jgi:hypothetical protein